MAPSGHTRLLDREPDHGFIAKFNEPGPYYSSYPTLGRWREGMGHDQYVRALVEFFEREPNAPIYLYLHIPFCAKLCWYCICNIQISNNRERIQRFVDVLLAEIDLLKRFFDCHGIVPNIREIHFGGGTPSHLDNAQVSSVVDSLRQLADVGGLDEFAMEIDPRTVTRDNLAHYHALGVDRISFGVQDFDPVVQERINRIQPFEMVRDLLSPDVRKMFSGVNFDLLYGLPMQTRDSFQRTVALTRELSPSRITLIKYAHAPEIRKHMKMIDRSELPAVEQLPLMFVDAVEALVAAGYDWIGIDNFARPDDALAEAARRKSVGRNFGGSTPGRADNIIGLGPTSTATFGRHYFQSVYDTNDYTKAVREQRFPIFKGFELSQDDLIRRDVIFQFQCAQELDFGAIERKFGIEFDGYFGREIRDLEPFIDQGMLEHSENGLRVTTLGRFFVRHICRPFDRFLQDGSQYRIHGP
ncbi:MAG: oxygen-independent coproporphyrinogen III oxidase [Alphaproteobacteria bacterium]|nr:oxygen-independent coproporphyrinogen III oxidase [Alphaproteobacteria bacterium]